MKQEIIDLYNDRINKREWIPWEEFLTLKVGDTITLKSYDYQTGEYKDTELITIKKLYRRISDDKWDYGIEKGYILGEFNRLDKDGKILSTSGTLGGTIAVNMDNISSEITPFEALRSWINTHYPEVDLTEFDETYYTNKENVLETYE